MSFLPMPRTYAVAQIDLPASLRGLGDLDRKARASLQKIRSSKAIIMLHTANGLPFPRNPDFKYFVYVVGPGLRPEDPEQCYTADMCMPIFPNTDHPTGRRPPVRTVPEFPFSNCYHWFGPDTSLMVRVKNDIYVGHGDPEYIKLPTGDYVDMEYIHQEDMNRMIEMRAERDKHAAMSSDTYQGPDSHGRPSQAAKHDDASLPEDDNDSRFGPELDDSDIDSLASGASYQYAESQNQSYISLPPALTTGSCDSAESLTESAIFRMQWTKDRSRIPVVTLSFDLAAEFKEEDVPSPEAFLKECSSFSR
ncbi:hypothetical protein K466DRAFT_485121 [Polyporus arcularius HHB13444]|uniref:Uncharacterized protein n=1 Tax=Polyporus arcularius HHB13444 TaxID=1314778 RepID=A0A5C3PLU1_9APHY|nr:hypothetical protein K466DRAFT_485121 [Polyporus arcularius HHB13444]